MSKLLVKNITSRPKRGIRQYVLLFVLIFVLIFIYFHQTQVLPQAAISLLDEMPAPQPFQKILIISPHPDDETLAAGGYIKSAIDQKSEVYIALVTNGNKHKKQNQRYFEFREATEILGVKPEFLIYLNYADDRLRFQSPLILKEQFKELLDKIKPEIVIYPIPEDHHSDHKICGMIMEELLINYPEIKGYEYLVHDQYYPQPLGWHKNMYLMPPLSLIKIGKRWQSWSFSSQTEKVKEQAIKMYKTQFRNLFLRQLLPAFVRKNEIFLNIKP